MKKYMIYLIEYEKGPAILNELFEDLEEAQYYLEILGFAKDDKFNYYRHGTRAQICRIKKWDQKEVVINGEVLTLVEVSKKYKIHGHTLHRRYDRGVRGAEILERLEYGKQ